MYEKNGILFSYSAFAFCDFLLKALLVCKLKANWNQSVQLRLIDELGV